MLQKRAKRTAVLRAIWLCKTEKYWTSTEMDVNMLFPDLGQFRSGNIERKKPLQQHGTVTQVHDSAWGNISCWVQNKSNSEIAGQLTIWVVYQSKLGLKNNFCLHNRWWKCLRKGPKGELRGEQIDCETQRNTTLLLKQILPRFWAFQN